MRMVGGVPERERLDPERALRQVGPAAQLIQVQKLESLGLLAGGVAHGINNLLTAILGGASSALMSIPRENPARQDVEHAIAAARHAAALTRQVLAYAGKGQIESSSLDLSELVAELAVLLETTMPRKAQLRLELAPDLPPIEAHAAQVQQIVLNLVMNAAEAIGEPYGTVLVATGVQLIDEVYGLSLFPSEGIAPGRYVFLEVHDTGRGMDEATKAKIFDPSFSTKLTGRGLGLAVVLAMVREHRGAIKVYSTPGQGTTFKVFFPVGDSSLPTEEIPSLDFRAEGLVLVIDDDPAVRTTTRRLLESFGFRVLDAADGVAGVRVFEENADEISLVLVDMTMPRMNGEETFQAIHRRRAEVPVILTSGYSEAEARRRFTSTGLAGFLEKPYTLSDLERTLARVLGIHH